MIDRRQLLAAAPGALAIAALAGPAAADVPPITAADMTLGSPTARVQVIEYASLSCPHCARWNADVWPNFNRRYVDTGRVRYALREFLTDPAQMATVGFLLARCAPRPRYFEAIDALFAAQTEIFQAPRPLDVYTRVAGGFGVSPQRLRACVQDRPALDALNARVNRNAASGVDSTPTFVVNGRSLVGEQTLAQMAAVIDPLLVSPARPARRRR